MEVVDRVTAYDGDARLYRTAEHAGHPALLHLLHRYPGDRRLLPDPDAAEGGADRHAQGHRHLHFDSCALAPSSQIVTINALGVCIGAVGSLLLSLTFPATVPIVFTRRGRGQRRHRAAADRPVGRDGVGMALLRVEPLTALGLAQ